MSKIDIIHIFAPNVLAGAERVVITGLNALVKEKINLTLFVIRELRAPQHAKDFVELLDPQIKIVFLDSKKALDLNLINELKKQLQKYNQQSTIIHTHGYKALLMLRLSKGTQNYHVVHTHHGNTSHTIKVKIYEWWAQKVMQKIDAVICVSEEMKKKLSAIIHQEKLIVIENMLSFQNAEKIRNERKNLILKHPIQLLYVGRLSPEKGILHFLKIFSQLEMKDKFLLHIVGDGPQRKDLETFLDEVHLKNVTLYGFLKDPSPHFKTAHALIMPSFTEGLPMTLIEALASGLPVIATNVGAISSLLINYENGLLLEDNDEKTWNNSLKFLIENIEKINSTTLTEAINIENKYSAKRWVEKTMELYLLSLK